MRSTASAFGLEQQCYSVGQAELDDGTPVIVLIIDFVPVWPDTDPGP